MQTIISEKQLYYRHYGSNFHTRHRLGRSEIHIRHGKRDTKSHTESGAEIRGDDNAALRTSRALAQLVYSVLKGVERLGDVLTGQGG